MKKLLLLIITSFIFIANSYAQNCSNEVINDLRNNVNIDYNIEYAEKIEGMAGFKGYENVLKITAPDSEYYFDLVDSEDRSILINNGYYAVSNGGIYTLNVYHNNCGMDIIKTTTIKVPYYNKDNKNIWDDGSIVKTNIEDKKESKNTNIIILLVITSISIIVGGIIFLRVVRKRSVV